MKKDRLVLLLATAIALLFFYPIARTLLSSLLIQNTNGDLQITLNFYFEVLFNVFWFYPMFWNSMFYGLGTALPALLIIIPGGFSLAKGKHKHKNSLTTLYFILMLMPIQAILLPNYIGLRSLGLLDTRLGILLPALFSPFGVYLMYRYMEEMPNDTIYAARLETSSLLSILFHIVIPQTKTAITAIFLFLFTEGYNLVEQPQLFLKREDLKPLSVLTNTISVSDNRILFASGILCLIPPSLLFSFFETELEIGIGQLKY